MRKIGLILMLVIIPLHATIYACTNFLITKKASRDGSTMITYAADSHVLFGELYFYPAADYPAGTMVDIYEWDTGKYLGKIKQVAHTFSVVGNMNEHQVAIGETTYGGREELGKPNGVIDYGSLIYTTLQRAKTAREAIKIMGDLVAEYGYASSGESFSISDANEVWIMEMIGKGEGEKGAVWVAMKIPDGYVSGHANQARITTFPLNDPENCIYSADVISFARKKTYFKGKDEEFSFSDTYAPVDFGGARFCDMRVWAMFRKVNGNMEKYKDYASGNIEHGTKFADGKPSTNGYATNRMPLWIKPDRKIGLDEVMDFMRDHLEGTEFDMSQDVGAGPYGCPYRWRPMTYQVDGQGYCHERTTATQQTGFSFVAQSRSWLPNPIGGILWFGVDDAASTVYSPMYCGMTKVPESFAVGNGDMMTFSFDAAFWVFNMVSNYAYTRYSYIGPEIRAKQVELENKYMDEVPAIDKKATELYATNPKEALAYLTDYSVKQGNATTAQWQDLYKYLFTKYMDGNIKEKDPNNRNPKLVQPGYSKDYYRRISETTGDKLKVKGAAGH